MSDDGHRKGYSRTTSLEFLERCAPRVASFYRYWDSKRKGRAMPSRADLEPSEMVEWLPGIVMVDVLENPRRLVYRLVGTRSVRLRQKDVTGKSVEEGYHGTSLAEILENYRLVIEEKKVVYDWDSVPSPDGLLLTSEVILTPLSTDGENVDKVFIYIESVEL